MGRLFTALGSVLSHVSHVSHVQSASFFFVCVCVAPFSSRLRRRQRHIGREDQTFIWDTWDGLH